MTQNFNGTYIFGGGPAPVLDTPTVQCGTRKYEHHHRGWSSTGGRSVGQPGGSPTAYTAVTGSPEIDFTQTRAAFFAQDEWKLLPNLKVSYGARYYVQNMLQRSC